jgi:hypothetical protein
MDTSARKRENRKDRREWTRTVTAMRTLPIEKIDSLDGMPETLDELRHLIGQPAEYIGNIFLEAA